MNSSRFLTAVLFSTLLLLVPLSAEAHRLNVFSWVGNNQIYGEAFFNGGRKAKHITIQIQKTDSDLPLLTVQTDEEGKFHFYPPQQTIQQKSDLLIVANTGDGHRSEWLLTADEYLPIEPQEITDEEVATPSNKEQSTTEKITTEMIRTIVREEINKELLPLKQKLAEEKEKEATPRDIIGGIGFIIGLAGILAWIQSKKKKDVSAKE